MHIALYSPGLPSSGSANGIVTYTRIMQAALRAAGHRATVFSRSGIEYDDGLVEQVPPDRRPRALFQRARTRIVGRSPVHWPVTFRHVIERVHACHPIDLIEIEESFGFAGRLGVDLPIVARLHGPHAFGKDQEESALVQRVSSARIAAERVAIAETDGLTSPSARLLQDTLDYYGLAPPRTATIQNPMPLSSLSWAVDEARPASLLFVGRFDLRKGADIALKAFALASRSIEGLTLTMCGPDVGIVSPSGVRMLFAEWAAQHLNASVLERITYLPNADQATLQHLRLRSSLLLSASRFETFSYSIAEALSVGLPVLMANTYGMPEVLAHGDEAIVAPVGEVEAVAEAIVAALMDRGRLVKIGAAGRERCAVLLSPTRIGAQTLQFYRDVIGSR